MKMNMKLIPLLLAPSSLLPPLLVLPPFPSPPPAVWPRRSSGSPLRLQQQPQPIFGREDKGESITIYYKVVSINSKSNIEQKHTSTSFFSSSSFFFFVASFSFSLKTVCS